MDKQDFDQLVELAMAQPGRNAMRPVVEKELLHYDIFHALDKAGLLKNLVFQGGTALRLCRGSNRFSEDLDFAGGKDFTSAKLHNIKACIEEHIGKRYGFKVAVKEPKQLASVPDYENITVDKWQISIETAPQQRDLPHQKIKIEIANIPAHTRELVPLRSNYDFLQGYVNVLVNTESLNEIMADKIIAFPAAQKVIRYRDIWDLAWLTQQGATLAPELVVLKIADYRLENYPQLLRNSIERLPSIINSKSFKDQMLRFIDSDTIATTLDNPQFLMYLLNTVDGLFTRMEKYLLGETDVDEGLFKM
jgi:predicted nucleotidyltransferase component of viral defense system